MRVLIIGANGQIGRILCEKLSRNHKYSPIAMIRSEKQKSFFEDIEVETLIGDLENSVNDIADYVKDCDVVIFTAGSGGHTG